MFNSGTGDFDRDGKPDIAFWNRNTGQVCIWLMDGVTVRSTNTLTQFMPDLDWRLCYAADFDQDANHPGSIDLLWRHITWGLDLFFYMDKTNYLSEDFLLPSVLDTHWRLAGQDTVDSTWRLDRSADLIRPTITATSTANRIALSWSDSLPQGTFTVQRRLRGATNWTTLTTTLTATNYVDTTVQPGANYEYWVSGGASGRVAPIIASAMGVPVEGRGPLILLVATNLTTSLATELTQLKMDLAGDGWTVISHEGLPLHNDTNWSVNPPNISNIHQTLRNDFLASTNTKGVLIIGHVAIPYSGYAPRDGHVGAGGLDPWDHRGAWPADLYYGDVDNDFASAWPDSLAAYENTDFVANSQGPPGDGKFDPDYLYFTNYKVQLFVGRVDFAQMPSLQATYGLTETDLVRRYLAKNHAYRHKMSPYPLAQRGIAYGSWDPFGNHDGVNVGDAYCQGARNSAVLFGSQLTVGDPFTQTVRDYMWGFAAGGGAPDRINWGSPPEVEHTTVELCGTNGVPRIAFYLLSGSYFGDPYCRRTDPPPYGELDKFLRASICMTNYGLAAMWDHASRWHLEPCAVGEPLGAALLYTHNDCGYPLDNSGTTTLSIAGDPTLRIHTTAPPTNVTGPASGQGTVTLQWTASPDSNQYFVYRNTASPYGPYSRIPAGSNPITGSSFTDTNAPPGQKFYMVRAIQVVTGGSGSYTNLSQGAFKTVN